MIRRIAVGSVAELYLTRTVGAEGLEKLACVKRVLPRFAGDASFVTAFASEARLAATLSHPNIAQVSDVGQEAGETFFSMEYVHGEDLGRLVTASSDNGVPISLDCALTVAAGLCAGLHHAHEKASIDGKAVGMIHRDVSPTNVIVSYDGAVKIVDFGIARATGEPIAPGAVLKGKISYMSPEQARGRGAVDRRSDVFSVGTILYQLTTGRLPFIDETEPGVRLKISSTDPPRPRDLVPGYAPALEAIVMRALAREPEARFATAMALQTQIEDFAHEHRLRVSPIVLARLMSTLFPARLEDWDHARAQGAFFVEQHVVHTLIENGKMADGSANLQLPADADGGELPNDETAIDETAIDIELADRTELGPLPRPAAQPRATRPSQPPVGAPARPSRPALPGVASPPSQPGVTTRPATPRAGRPSSPLVNALPAAQPRAGRTTQPPGPGSQPRAGRPSQPPPIAAAQPRAGEREQPVAPALPNPALPMGGAVQAAWPQPPSTHPSPQAAAWSQPVPVPEPSLQSWAATSSPDASPWAATSSPDASPWAATSSPDASPWAATSSPDASPWGQAPQGQSIDPFGSQPAPQDLRAGRAMPLSGVPRPMPIAMVAPPVPSGGTLVSSATLAGNQPPPVRPVHGPFGQGGLDGFAGQNGLDSFTSHGTPGGLATDHHGAAPRATGRPAAAVPPTLKIRVARRSSLPLVAFALVGAAAVAGGAWFLVGRADQAAPSPASDRASSPAPVPVPVPGAKPTPPTAAPPPSAEPAPTQPAPSAPNAPSPGSEPSRETAQVAPPPPAADEAKPEPPKKKPVAAPVPDARAKAAKPKPRVEPKRGAKSQPKEQPWNDDSPFMPVATPKR